jgi:hypothetical protein
VEKEVHARVEPLNVIASLMRSVAEHPDWSLNIAFLEDGSHVEVSVCDT